MERAGDGAAFFDVDRTLLPGVSAEMLLARGLLRGTFPGRFRWLPFLIEALRLLPNGVTIARKANKAYLAGAAAEEVRVWGERLFASEILPRLDPAREDWVEDERGRGRAIVLLSGMPDILLTPFARRFRADHAIGTPLEIDARGRLTGRRAGPHPYGEAKLEIARRLARRNGWDPARCSAYGDHASDVRLLEWVGEAHAVDPDARLRRESLRRGWTIHESRGRH